MFFPSTDFLQEIQEFIDAKVFVETIGLPQYEETFKKNIGEVRGLPIKKLKTLKINHLPMMNITQFDHQKMLIRGIEQLIREFEEHKAHLKAARNSNAKLAADLDHLLTFEESPAVAEPRLSSAGQNVESLPTVGQKELVNRYETNLSRPRSRQISEASLSDVDRKNFKDAAWNKISKARGQMDKDSKNERLSKLRRQSIKLRSSQSREVSTPNSTSGMPLRSFRSSMEDPQISEAQKARMKAREYGDAALRHQKLLTELLRIRERVLSRFQQIVNCERASIMFVDTKRKEIFFYDENKLQRRFPSNKGIAGHVVSTGERVNIPDAYADPRFNRDMDKQTGFKTRSILCAPIRSRQFGGAVLAVIQMLNKVDEPHFSHNDEEVIESCALDVSEVLEPKFRDLMEAMEDFAGKGSNVHANEGAAKPVESRLMHHTNSSVAQRRESWDLAQAEAQGMLVRRGSRRLSQDRRGSMSTAGAPDEEEVDKAIQAREKRLSYGKEIRDKNAREMFG
mmetsp:Transcript_38252/g.50398  ORF Transcript_38252/g.50398 Transcript_38252/m.50398 type:complete len:510 (+) Transcript_38252:249-1778(+)|eukprot:CAMPEP_0117751112 /NCGR_PEP_ID=MMETSP0947-20121206/10776_1 /TAXON_ID=44440 /ORGANISM="Chattonella subsalsa, Strain CCMP2191" /LENGTH=509 /DNA_ID=CAMNT_0005569421 /DNA_START=248 /DNA_END=1777 /DNA_ORIENTATION=-